MNDKAYDRQYALNELLLHAIEGDLSEEQIQELNHLIVTYPDTAGSYLEFINLYSELSPYGDAGLIDVSKCDSETQKYDLLLKSLAHQENTSPHVEPAESAAEPETELVCHVTYGDARFFTLKKASMVSLILSTAALLLLVLFARYAPQKRGLPVATLIDSLEARWSGETNPLQKGESLAAGTDTYVLEKGYAQFRFTNETLVTFEGPAEFQILTDEQIKLSYGKVYSIVPRQAFGFMVSTPGTKIIDLGTEFGVQYSPTGNTEVYVIKGRTSLISGAHGNQINMTVTEGSAKRIFASSRDIEDIPCDRELFARDINSESNIVWRGQGEINLADIVGGGDGFGTGRLNAGIDVTTGKAIGDLMNDEIAFGSAGCREVKGRRFIEGVFVPGLEEMTPVTCDGSICVEFEKTSGNYWGGVFNGAFHKGYAVPRHVLKLNGTVFGDAKNPSISIHSNQGITFDLSELRRSISDLRITQFRSLVGLSETVKEYADDTQSLDAEALAQTVFSKAKFHVFVDGKKVYEQEMSNVDRPIQIEIPIHPNDRYLTLAVTEADDSYAYDWALFGRPELILE